MLSYPVMTGDISLDERIYARLRQGAVAQELNDVRLQHCILTFARRMIHSMGERKWAGKPMTGAAFSDWLEISAQNHSQHFLSNYHAVSANTYARARASRFDAFASKQTEASSGGPGVVMLSDYDGVLASAACQLTSTSRIIVLWHYFGGITVSEIAAKIGLNEAGVRARIVRASREMQMVLARRGYAGLSPNDYCALKTPSTVHLRCNLAAH